MSENEANFSPPQKRPRLSPFTSSSSLDHIVSFTSLPCSLLHSLPPDVLPTPYMIIPLLSPSFTSSSTTISSFRLSHPSTPLFPQSDSYSCGYNCFRGIVGPFLTPSPQTPLEVCPPFHCENPTTYRILLVSRVRRSRGTSLWR